jgi:hypothetical protein
MPCLSLNAQKQLTQNFQFASGVYQDFEAFQKNQPTYNAASIEGNFFINQTTKQAKVEYIRLKDTKEQLDLDKIWGIVIKGQPYIKVSPNLPKHSLKVFASLEVKGNICYYAYDDLVAKDITFKAYNPLIGKPYRSAKLKRKIPVIKEEMLRFSTGATSDFNYLNLINWIADDKEITQALKSLGPKKAEDKLFDALLRYNERHLVLTKK